MRPMTDLRSFTARLPMTDFHFMTGLVKMIRTGYLYQSIKMESAGDSRIYKIAMTGLFAALSYVVFTFLQFKITLPGGDATSIHLGNAVCVLGALLLGGFYGGLGGAIGMTIGDLLDPVYVIYAPKTMILKLCIGLITGLVAHKMGKIKSSRDPKHIFRWSLAAAICGLGFNVIADPLLGYYYKILIIGQPAASLRSGLLDKIESV